MSRFIPVNFRSGYFIDYDKNDYDKIKELVCSLGFSHIYEERFKDDPILNVELKQPISTISKLLKLYDCVDLADFTDRGLSLYFVGQAGDETVFIPFDNIACIVGYNYIEDKKNMIKDILPKVPDSEYVDAIEFAKARNITPEQLKKAIIFIDQLSK